MTELAARLEMVRLAMAASDLDGLIVSVPENIYYLTGLDHWGFFACHILVVPRDGRPVLVARAMERITIENQVANAPTSMVTATMKSCRTTSSKR